MKKKAKIFDKTKEDYLSQISDIDLKDRADLLGATYDDGALLIPFYNLPYRVSKKGVFNSSGDDANFAASVVLCCYILQCPESAPAIGEWVTYREFRDSGPLTSYFTANTNKIIETTFSGQLNNLKSACENMGGQFVDTPSFDLADPHHWPDLLLLCRIVGRVVAYEAPSLFGGWQQRGSAGGGSRIVS
jgi:hypothetical protein